MKAGLLLAAAAALYAVAAWSVKPGLYDCCAAPNYDYVSPPPLLEPGNVKPTSGSATVGSSGGVVTTRDQPNPQATIQIPADALEAPAAIGIKAFAPLRASGELTITGNVYCITSSSALNPGTEALVRLAVPPYQPFPTAMYRSKDLDGPWTSLPTQFDQGTYFMSAKTAAFGCFAVGYKTPTASSAPRIGGGFLPIVTAALIAIVLLIGLPFAIRRRAPKRG